MNPIPWKPYLHSLRIEQQSLRYRFHHSLGTKNDKGERCSHSVRTKASNELKKPHCISDLQQDASHHCMQFFHSIFGSLHLITCHSALIILRNKSSSVPIHFLREVRYWHILVKYQCLIFQVFLDHYWLGHGISIKTWKISCPWMYYPIAIELLENSFPEEVFMTSQKGKE